MFHGISFSMNLQNFSENIFVLWFYKAWIEEAFVVLFLDESMRSLAVGLYLTEPYCTVLITLLPRLSDNFGSSLLGSLK